MFDQDMIGNLFSGLGTQIVLGVIALITGKVIYSFYKHRVVQKQKGGNGVHQSQSINIKSDRDMSYKVEQTQNAKNNSNQSQSINIDKN